MSSPAFSPEERLIQARRILESRGVAEAALLEPAISASWARCLASGLDPRQPPKRDTVGEPRLRAAREQHGLVRALALAEMQALYHQIAGSNFLIAFAAPDGILLDTIADASFRGTARAASIQPGTLWTEPCCGTNALGTAAAMGRALAVHGDEHFFASFGTLTCTAAPVFGPDGQLAGMLDASSHCGSRQQHTQALVAMAATQVENGLFRHHHRTRIIVAFHSRGEYLHTLSAGLLAIDPDGVVRGVTPRARFMLQGLPAVPGRHFDDVFRTPFARLFDSMGQGHHRLEDRVGSAFVAGLENIAPPHALAKVAPKPASPGFVAEDAVAARAVQEAAAAAQHGVSILIHGETGTGKELLARYAHQASGRRGAFVPVNCAALPESLIEAELFGHAEGAFTGARRGGHSGLVCEADGGTLFLDEIGDMRLPLQSVLLRLLDDWTVRPVGGGPGRRVDVLLVAATNAALDQAVSQGQFRADLFYRLTEVSLTVPPLRSRTDLAAVASHVLALIAPERRISEGALARLALHAWPGNVRELRNLLLRLSLRPGGTIEASDVEHAFGTPAILAAPTLREATRARIKAAHDDTGGNLSETARRLGVSRNTVYRAIRANIGFGRSGNSA